MAVDPTTEKTKHMKKYYNISYEAPEGTYRGKNVLTYSCQHIFYNNA